MLTFQGTPVAPLQPRYSLETAATADAGLRCVPAALSTIHCQISPAKATSQRTAPGLTLARL
eukprot:1520389-Prymnesium_polylepis.1